MNRRILEFDNFSEIIDDVKRLSGSGYQRLGNWDLVQICGHLADWATFPVIGFPPARFPINLMLWMMRNTVGPSMVRKILSSGKMKESMPTMPETVKEPAVEAREEMERDAIEKLDEALRNFEAHQHDYHRSPVFGNLTRDQARQLQLIHCGHHLSFLVPESDASNSN